MDREDLKHALSHKMGITLKEANLIIDTFVGTIVTAIKRGESWHIRGFGAFKPKYLCATKPFNCGIKNIGRAREASISVKFKPFKELKQRVNHKS